MSATYSTKQASDMTGASRQIIRLYTTKYARYLSTEATPDQGQERRFTQDDLRLIAYVYQQTQANHTHSAVLQMLADGALQGFAWTPKTEASEAIGPEPSYAYPLALAERLQGAQASLALAQEREQALLDELMALRQELGRAQGALEEVRRHKKEPPRWWTALFGR